MGADSCVSKRFPAKLDKLNEMLTFILQVAGTVDVDRKVSTQVELAAEEALVNIINYAYGDTSGDIEISCEVVDGNVFRITLKDQGMQYNPIIGLAPVKKDAPLEERKVGGLGLQMISKLMDEASYNYSDGSNIFTLTKYLA